MSTIYKQKSHKAIKILPVTKETFSTWLQQANSPARQWANSCAFRAESGQLLLLPDESGQVSKVLLGLRDAEDFWAVGQLPTKLSEGLYLIEEDAGLLDANQYERALLAWGLGCYQFDSYTKREKIAPQLSVPEEYQIKELENLVSAIAWVRDLINAPANELGPDELAAEALKLAKEHGAESKIIKGEALLEQGFPSIYTVGQAALKEPHLIELTWGSPSAPKVTLVGKGVCFDSGGLDIKSAANMLGMKKDMGGAAHVLGLARLIMQRQLNLRLHVLIPAVENSVDGKSYRPGDVIKTRSGVTVEVGNTDAEGRVVLSDALTYACAEKPDYLIDFATLTGAARVALGPEIAALFSNEETFAAEVLQASQSERDPVWRLPLYQPYTEAIKGEIADISNTGKLPYGGAITAALFLQRFVDKGIPWMHFDLMAANLESKPGRPLGGEAQGLRAVYRFLCDKFS